MTTGPLFVHLCAGLFAFYDFSGTAQSGASSVVGCGKLLLNLSFPRALQPLSAVRTAFYRFLPTMLVYVPIHVIFGQPLTWQMLLDAVFILMLTVFGAGMAMIFATMQVYFRDTTSFLPYFIRIWLYLSPILWFLEDVPERFRDLALLNPLYSMIGGWSDVVVRSGIPDVALWLAGTAWAVVALAVGTLFFMSRSASLPSVSEATPVTVSTTPSGPAVRVESVSVTYRTTFERRPTFKSALVRFGRGERAAKEVQAV
jgi:ABC-type polysaccharide/polyol phosphate export permease